MFFFFINVAVSSLLRMSPLRLLYLPFLFFAFSCTPQGLHRLRISACAPLCSIRAALHKATADSSHSEASFEITSARDFMVMSLLPGDASHVDPMDAGAMCSVRCVEVSSGMRNSLSHLANEYSVKCSSRDSDRSL